jgi:hypothetical protein
LEKSFCANTACRFDHDLRLGMLFGYTESFASGRRIQISGPLLMPWKFVIVRMGELAAE